MMPLADQTKAVREVLEKNQPLAEIDLQVLRENTAAASGLSSKADYFSFRMEIELIDAIRKLNETSTRLARVGIWVTCVGVGLAFLQVLLVAGNLLRH